MVSYQTVRPASKLSVVIPSRWKAVRPASKLSESVGRSLNGPGFKLVPNIYISLVCFGVKDTLVWLPTRYGKSVSYPTTVVFELGWCASTSPN